MFNRLAMTAATFGLVVILGGCTSPLTQATLTGPNVNRNDELQHGRHLAQPASGSSGDLLYVAPGDFRFTSRKNRASGGVVAYYTYPAGKLVGTLSTGGRGLCSDSRGNVFVVNDGGILEFAHGGTSPINILGNSDYSYESCSVDPGTGNLAVTFGSGNVAGIAIFKNATGNQTTYTDADFEHLYYCGYDGSGNLFADGFKPRYPWAFAELPAGSSEFETIQLNRQIEKPGQVQWDGEYITIADEPHQIIYRVEINGSEATVVGKTKFGGFSRSFFGSWIYAGTVIVPFTKKHGIGYIGFWNYPRGGSPTKTFPGPGYDTGDNAVTISPGS
ncbi:MAG: hypothetical protein WAK11_03870 [Candidatus Cybelea sp.]